jgi:hypothetical protein
MGRDIGIDPAGKRKVGRMDHTRQSKHFNIIKDAPFHNGEEANGITPGRKVERVSLP